MIHLVDPSPVDLRPFVDEAVARFEIAVPDEGPFADVVGFRVQWTDSLHGSNVVSLRCSSAIGGSADPNRRYLDLVIEPGRGVLISPGFPTDDRTSMLAGLRGAHACQEIIDNVIRRTSAGQPRRVARLVTAPPGRRPFELDLDMRIVAAAGSFDPSRPPAPRTTAPPAGSPVRWVDWSYQGIANEGALGTGGTFVSEAATYVVHEDNHTGWQVTLGPEPSVYVWKEDYDDTTSWRGRVAPSEAAALLVNPRLFAELIGEERDWVVDSPHRGRYRAVEAIPDGGIGRGGW